MVHGVSPLLIEILAGINQQDTPLLLSLRTPEITITREQHYRQTLQMNDLKLAEYNELRSHFPLLAPIIDKAVSDAVEESREIQGKLAAVERILTVIWMITTPKEGANKSLI